MFITNEIDTNTSKLEWSLFWKTLLQVAKLKTFMIMIMIISQPE